MVDGRFAAPRAPLDLFDFANGRAERHRARAAPGLGRRGGRRRGSGSSFLRPLSSALVHFDRALFGDALWAYHAHSIAAWALLVDRGERAVPAAVQRGVAALATLIFAVDHSQHFPVLWLSNRGGIYAMRSACSACSRICASAIDGSAAYAWLARAVLLDRAALRRVGAADVRLRAGVRAVRRDRCACAARLRALICGAGPAALFMVARALLGYGARGSDAYVDPAAEPRASRCALVQRVPVLDGDMMFNVPASWWDHGSPWRERILGWELLRPRTWSRLPGWPLFHVALGVLALVAFSRCCVRTRARHDRARTQRMLVLAARLAAGAVPVVGSFLSTRLTLAAFLRLRTAPGAGPARGRARVAECPAHRALTLVRRCTRSVRCSCTCTCSRRCERTSVRRPIRCP